MCYNATKQLAVRSTLFHFERKSSYFICRVLTCLFLCYRWILVCSQLMFLLMCKVRYHLIIKCPVMALNAFFEFHLLVFMPFNEMFFFLERCHLQAAIITANNHLPVKIKQILMSKAVFTVLC